MMRAPVGWEWRSRTGMLMAAAVLALLLVSSSASAQDAAPTANATAFIHFFVVPATGADDSAVMEALRGHLIDLAGGFTELGPAAGGERKADGMVELQQSIAFLVSAKTDISRQLEAFIASRFQESAPFVLVWRGQCSLYRQ